MSQSTSTDNRGIYFTVFLLGLALPIAGVLIWSARSKKNTKHQRADDAQMVAVEDSFPASDPPSAW